MGRKVWLTTTWAVVGQVLTGALGLLEPVGQGVRAEQVAGVPWLLQRFALHSVAYYMLF